MDAITSLLKRHYAATFRQHGPTARGVDWRDHREMLFRYSKMLALPDLDIRRPRGVPSLLDVGCGWGGLYAFAKAKGRRIRYTGIDVVPEMIAHARSHQKKARFIHGDVFSLSASARYDYVVCNAILTQKLTASIPAMEAYANRLLRRMFELCRYGMAANFMSTRVNYMADNLYYRNPMELLHHCLSELSPRVILDHGYSSLKTGKGKYYDYTVYVYKD